MEIIRAGIDDVDRIAPLFDLYRQFYEQTPDIKGATAYLKNRLQNKECIIFLALSPEQVPWGFTQIYPSFCSVSMANIFILYDLFVARSARNQGVGTALLNQAKIQANQDNVSRIDLQTAQDNLAAQKIYRAFGYLYSDEFQNWTYEISH